MAGELVTFGREEFRLDRWHYYTGDHVLALAPTTCGKTTWLYQLAEVTATPRLPFISLVMKPKDKVVTRWTKALRHRKVRHWPPVPSLSRPPGYVLWPRTTFDPDVDDAAQYREFRAAILGTYRRGNRILFADELYSLCEELNLEREVITIYTKGSSQGCGLWAATQKPSHIPTWAYSMSHHLFLAHDPDWRNRRRYGEIGGVDPKLVENATLQLQQYQWLYIRRYGTDGRAELCIVDR